MTNDDESFLSAYMDGQLDFDQQQRVESALAASPNLAERLRGLILVRDMVASLPQDGSIDVSARVMQQIQARRRQRGFLPTLEGWRYGSRRILPLAGLAATAATLMVAASLAILLQTSQLDRERAVTPLAGGPVAGQGAGPAVAHADRAVAPANASAPETITSESDTKPAAALAKNVVPAATALADSGGKAPFDAGEAAIEGSLAHLRPLLDNPDLKRFFLIRGGAKDQSEQTVASIVEHTTHLDFFKITVSQGIVIDPRHPEQATVFAFVLNTNQVDRFHDQLKVALPGLVEQQPLEPAIATQLAEISAVQSLAPASLARVEIPHEALALRNAVDPAGGNDTARLSDPVTVLQPPAARPDNRVVVLVWVSGRPAK